MKRLFVASLLFCLSSLSYAVPESVGTVILSFGQNVAVSGDGAERELKRKSDIYSDDLLKTGKKGRLQIRFTDGSRLSLKPDTVFKITEYRFEDGKAEDGKAIYKLLKGGMRTISGKIGKVDRDDYKLDAVVATIGIRGTDFTVNKRGDQVSGSVIDGKINVTSKLSGDSKNINSGRSFDVSSGDGRISDRKTPPSDATSEEESSTEEESEGSSGNESEEQGDGTSTEGNESNSDNSTSDSSSAGNNDDSSGSGVTLSTSTSATNTDSDANTPPASDPSSEANQTVVIASPDPTGNGTAAPEGAVVAVAFIDNETGEGLRANSGSVNVDVASAVTLDDSMVTGILYVDPDPDNEGSESPCAPCSFSAEAPSQIMDEDNIIIYETAVSWGRWGDGFELVENGNQQETTGSFHFMYAEALTPDSVMSNKSGTFHYNFQGEAFTPPESENTALGTLDIGDGTSDTGTYMTVDWDDYIIERVRISGTTGSGGEERTFTLFNQDTGGQTIEASLNDVLNGGDLELAGTCQGGDCSSAASPPGALGNETQLEGRARIDFIGSDAQGIITTYGAEGISPDNNKVIFTGTTLLEQDPNPVTSLP